LTGCDHKPAPIKEGILTRVTWSSEPGNMTAFYRETPPAKLLPGQGGQYGVDMYGLLYPTCLEVRLVNSKDSHAHIIPLNQIIWLEFGDGGIVLNKH
jgi:hypothetical protein